MDENHQDTTESKLTTTKDLRWVIKGKSKLWVPKRKRQTGFSGKTLWDWLNLLGILAIPLVVVGATIVFGLIQTNLAQKQHDSDQAIAKQQHASDQAIALDQQRAAILQT